MQRITGQVNFESGRGLLRGGQIAGVFSNGTSRSANTSPQGSSSANDLAFNSADSPNARTSATTDGETQAKSATVFKYLFVGSYEA
jgi:hypothetical protein